MEEKDIVFSAYSRKLLRELKNTRLLLEKGDIKGAKKLLEEGNCHVVKWNTINEAVDKIGHLADIL